MTWSRERRSGHRSLWSKSEDSLMRSHGPALACCCLRSLRLGVYTFRMKCSETGRDSRSTFLSVSERTDKNAEAHRAQRTQSKGAGHIWRATYVKSNRIKQRRLRARSD